MLERKFLVRFTSNTERGLPNTDEFKALFKAAIAGSPRFDSVCAKVEEVGYDFTDESCGPTLNNPTTK